MDQLCEKKPDMVTREVICKSIQNRPVSALISLETNENVVSEPQDKIHLVEKYRLGRILSHPPTLRLFYASFYCGKWQITFFSFLWQMATEGEEYYPTHPTCGYYAFIYCGEWQLIGKNTITLTHPGATAAILCLSYLYYGEWQSLEKYYPTHPL
jgi:hypothetical protein